MSQVVITDKINPESSLERGKPQLHNEPELRLAALNSQQAFDLLQAMALAVKDTAEKVRKVTKDDNPDIVITIHPGFVSVSARANETD